MAPTVRVGGSGNAEGSDLGELMEVQLVLVLENDLRLTVVLSREELMRKLKIVR
jgi:hypothetical protein